MTATVIEVTDDEVVVEVVASVPGREMPAQERRRERKKTMTIRDGFELIGYSEATLTVADEELECIVVTAKDPEGVEWKSYSSYSVPVDGLVRVERDGVVVIEIVEWGFPSES